MVKIDLIVKFRDESIEKFKNLLLLDRDGVVVENVDRNSTVSSARNVNEMIYTKSLKKSLNKIYLDNTAIVIVTNQPELSRDTISLNEMYGMNEKLLSDLPIAGIICCPHISSHECQCRKPNTYMLEKAITIINPSNRNILMIGDRETDLQAGKAINIDVVHISKECNVECLAEKHFNNLFEGTEYIIEYFKNN
jgi:D-glycero-D-manno-heptose 1,7-bisphosphate phosphatase